MDFSSAKEIYRQIGSVESPALSGSVAFTNIGLNHLLRRGRSLRPSGERNKRFKLLQYAPQMIGAQEASIYYQQKISGKTIHFWAFSAIIEKQKVKVIVSQINKGTKQFLSIMAR